MPSVRGTERSKVIVAMTTAAVAAAAVVGFASGVLAIVLRLPVAGAPLAGAIVALAALLDAVAAITGRPIAPALRRQVPRLWTDVLSLPTAAALYGSRLGVGPATVSVPWLWWAGAVLAAPGGPWTGASAGAVYGALRVTAVVVTSLAAEADMPRRMALLRARRTAASIAVSGAAGSLALACAVVAAT